MMQGVVVAQVIHCLYSSAYNPYRVMTQMPMSRCADQQSLPCGIGVGRTREEAEGKGIKSVTGMPAGGHPLAVHDAIFRHCHTVVLSKPVKHVDEDMCWNTPGWVHTQCTLT